MHNTLGKHCFGNDFVRKSSDRCRCAGTCLSSNLQQGIMVKQSLVQAVILLKSIETLPCNYSKRMKENSDVLDHLDFCIHHSLLGLYVGYRTTASQTTSWDPPVWL